MSNQSSPNQSPSRQAHTPGPWEAHLDDPTLTVYAGDMKIADVRGWGYLIGAGAMNLPFEEAGQIQDANARLMAAAPDLLAACEAYFAFQANDDFSDYLAQMNTVEEALRKAVAKAKGLETKGEAA